MSPGVRRALPLLGVAVLAWPFLAPALREGVYVGNGTDLYSYQLPMRRALRAILQAGEWPTWNPWLLGGVPLLAGLQLGVLYPPNLLGALLPPEQSLEWLRAAHGLWLVAGGVALSNAARRRPLFEADLAGLATAAVLAGAGQTWGHIYAGHVSFTQAWAWTPWIWALALRCLHAQRPGPALWTAAALALQLLAGHPQVSYLSGVGLVVLLAGGLLGSPAPRPWRGALWLAGVPVLALALAAAQLWPTAELAPLLNRSLANADTLPLAFSAPPYSLLTAVAWEGFGGPGPRLTGFSYHETLAHVGAVALVLALAGVGAGRRALVWGLGLALFVALSPGRHGPVMPALLGVLPGLGLFRVPGRWLLPATALLAVLAGQAVARLQTEEAPVRWRALALPALAGVGALALAGSVDPEAGWWREAIRRPGRAPEGGLAPLAQGTRDALWWVPLAAVALVVAARKAGARQVAVPVLVAALSWQSLSVAMAHVERGRHWPEARVDWSPGLAAGLRNVSGDQGRVATSPRLRHADWGGAHGVAVAGGYETAVPLWTNRFVNLAAGRRFDRYAVNLQIGRPSPWLTRMAGTAYLRHARGRAFPEWPEAARSGDLVLQRHPRPMPRVHLAEEVAVEPDRATALRRLGRLRRGVTLLSEALPHDTSGGPGRIEAVASGATRLSVKVRTPAPRVLVVRDVLLPGWQARVDGQPAPIVLADGLFRAVAVPAGSHEVQLRYEAPGLRAGLAVSGAAWLLWLLALGLLRRRAARPA